MTAFDLIEDNKVVIDTNNGVIHYYNDSNIQSIGDVERLLIGLAPFIQNDKLVYDYYEILEVLEEAKYISSGIIEEQG